MNLSTCKELRRFFIVVYLDYLHVKTNNDGISQREHVSELNQIGTMDTVLEQNCWRQSYEIKIWEPFR
jgi:hypothetical protein